MAIGRSHHACAVLEKEELLIAAGGLSDGWNWINSVEIMDLTTKVWSNAGTMPHAGAVWTAGKFFFLLGSELYQYESYSDRWLKLEDVPFDPNSLHYSFVQVDAGFDNFCTFL